MESLLTAYQTGFYVYLPLNVIAAWRWGGREERQVAMLYTVAALATLAVRSSREVVYFDVESGVAIVDAILLGGLVLVAARSLRWWPAWSASFQLIALSSHLARAASPDLSRMAYAAMVGLSGYPTQILLSIAIYRHVRAQGAALNT